jgi:hypothetical protein
VVVFGAAFPFHRQALDLEAVVVVVQSQDPFPLGYVVP